MFEEIGVFYRGLVIGLMVAAPVGPIGLLCIRRTLQKGLVAGFATGLGAACADTLFGAIAALGIAEILELMHHYDLYIRVIGGFVLLFGAWHTWHDKPEKRRNIVAIAKKMVSLAKEESLWGLSKAFLTGLAITLTNPATIFGILAVVAAFGHLDSRLDTGTFISGIFFGSTLWWLILSGGISLVRHHFTESRIMWINHGTAIILAAIAFWAISSGLMGFLRHLPL